MPFIHVQHFWAPSTLLIYESKALFLLRHPKKCWLKSLQFLIYSICNAVPLKSWFLIFFSISFITVSALESCSCSVICFTVLHSVSRRIPPTNKLGEAMLLCNCYFPVWLVTDSSASLLVFPELLPCLHLFTTPCSPISIIVGIQFNPFLAHQMQNIATYTAWESEPDLTVPTFWHLFLLHTGNQ